MDIRIERKLPMELAGLEARLDCEVGCMTITHSCVTHDGKAVTQEK